MSSGGMGAVPHPSAVAIRGNRPMSRAPDANARAGPNVGRTLERPRTRRAGCRWCPECRSITLGKWRLLSIPLRARARKLHLQVSTAVNGSLSQVAVDREPAIRTESKVTRCTTEPSQEIPFKTPRRPADPRPVSHAHSPARQAAMTGPGDPYSASPPGRSARVRLRLAACRRHYMNWRALVAIIVLSSLLAPGVAAVIGAVL